jgi:hypothetical protein
LTTGAEMRKEKVTPRGTPDVTKPMNRGTAEHEQNGVTTPRSAASPLPMASRRPASVRRVRSGVKNDRMIPTPKTTTVSRSRTLGASKTKNSTAEERRLSSRKPNSP